MSENLTYQERLRFENMVKEQGGLYIAGVDEAGRGPLAGPVVAACVIFDLSKQLPDANDSKKLTEKKRDELFDLVINSCISYGIGIVPANVIDDINILQATYLAMKNATEEALSGLSDISPTGTFDFGNDGKLDLLVDHVHIPNLPDCIFQRSITHGDALSVSIGAASILAKVTRDRIMTELDKVYPGYGFAKHKGYGTKAHYDAIKALGISEIHRRSFLKTIH